jgi:Na+-transporting NADH:ubiquinone oxidoreductase subunit NqrF
MAITLPPTTAATGNTNTNTLMQSQSQNIEVFALDSVQNPEISALFQLLLKNQKDTHDNTHSLQKYIAGLWLNNQRIMEMISDYGMSTAQQGLDFQGRHFRR